MLASARTGDIHRNYDMLMILKYGSFSQLGSSLYTRQISSIPAIKTTQQGPALWGGGGGGGGSHPYHDNGKDDDDDDDDDGDSIWVM